MRVMTRLVVAGVLMACVPAVPAHAQWRWLEHMSGPGWYDGVSLEFKVYCWYPTASPLARLSLQNLDLAQALAVIEQIENADVLQQLIDDEQQGKKREQVLKALDDRRALTVSMPCWSRNAAADVKRPRRSTVGWSTSLLWSTINRLKYADDVAPEDTQVWVWTLGVFADTRIPERWLPATLEPVFEHLEFGGTLEPFLFFGRTTRQMWRLAAEGRGAVRLYTFKDRGGSQNPVANIKVRVGALWLNDGFAPTDFGALPGPRLSGKQVHTSVRVLLDFECLPWRSLAC